ncbi:MAG: SLC13 family permease [Peptococcaceae bacterium]|nr:SLC13 family permease [Peptococcaceae bacterium]
MSETAKGMSKAEMIKWLVTIGIAVVLALIPCNDIYTVPIKQFCVITIFFLLVIAFEFFDNMIPAILMPTCWALIGVSDWNTAFSGFTNSTVFMIFGAFVFANILQDTGLLKRIAFLCIYRLGGNFRGLMIGIFVAGVVLSFITFGNAYVIMGTITLGICAALGLKPGKTSSALMMMVILGTLSVRVFTYSPALFEMLSAQAQIVIGPDFDLTLSSALMHQWPIAIVCVLMVFIFIRMYRPEEDLVGGKEHVKKELDRMGSLSLREKKALVMLMLLLIYLLTNPIHGWDSQWGFLIIPFLCFFPGLRVAEARNTIKKVNYSMIFFMASCISIGGVATSLGIGKVIASLCLPIFSNVGSYTQLILIWLLTFALNFVMTPLAIMSTITVPVCEIALSLNIDPTVYTYAILHGCEAILFPYEYVAYLVVYSFGMMTMKEFIKMNAIRVVIALIGFGVLCIPYWSLIGLM